MKALVVDDSLAARFMIGKIVKELGAEVVEAVNGKDALQKISDNRDCTVALVDWNMPVMTGFEFVKQIRLDPAFNNLKILMVTTETEYDQVIKALEAGANEYLMKPFDKQMVLDKLRMLGVYEGE